MGKKERRKEREKERKKERKKEKERNNYYNHHLCLLLSEKCPCYYQISGRVSSISVSTEIDLDTCILPVFYGPDFKRKKFFCRDGI